MSPRTLRVFEHQTVRVGERLRAEDGAIVALTKADFEAIVRFNDVDGGRFVDVGHQRIKFRNYVGYFQVGSLGIEILPKADRAAAQRGGEALWRQGLLKMIEVAGGMRLESPSAAAQSTTRSSLLELVAARFTEETERLLREGLARGYRDEEGNGATFRGRLLVAPNIRENLAREDRFYVRYQAYDRDIVINRILGAALDALGGLPLSAGVAARAAACRSAFPEVSEASLVPGLFERIAPGRSTARYRDALVLARMILEQHAPQLRAGRTSVFALLFDMNLLWERYVAALFRRAAAPGIVVSTQESRHFWRAHSRQSRTVRPDIVVRSPALNQPLLVVDTKWKVLRDGAPSDEDLKQMFVYNELFGAPRALLVYPSVSEAPRDRAGPFAGREHGCGTVHLGLFDATGWSNAGMRAQVKDLLETPTTRTHSSDRDRVTSPLPSLPRTSPPASGAGGGTTAGRLLGE